MLNSLIQFIINHNFRILLFYVFTITLLKFAYHFFIPFLWYPTGVDVFYYIQGAETILKGGILYQDFGDHKPAGIFFLYALVKLIGFDYLVGIKILDIVFQSFTAFFIFQIVLLFFQNRITAFAMGIVFLLASALNWQFWFPNVMFLSLLPLLIAFYLILKQEYNLDNKTCFLSGLMLGIGFWISSNLIFYFFIYPIYFFYLFRNIKKTIFYTFWAGIGFILPLGITIIYFVSAYAFSDWLWWNYYWPTIYMGKKSFLGRIWPFLDSFREIWMLIPLYISAIWGLIIGFSQDHWKKERFFVFVILFFAFSLVSRMVFPSGAHRYFIYLLPAFVLASSYTYQKKYHWAIKIFYASIILLGFIYSHFQGFHYSYTTVQKEREKIIQAIEKHSSPKDKIFVWLEGYEIYYYSKRNMATSSFSTSSQLAADSVWANAKCRLLEIPWGKFFQEIKRDKPILFIDQKPDLGGFYEREKIQCETLKKYLQELENYLLESYRVVEEIDSIDLWKNKVRIKIWKRKE